MTVTIPHFDLPFRFGTAGGNAAVVQQDSVQDVRNCVETVVRTEAGNREFVPNFGIADPTFSVQPLDTTALEQQVTANEPRAQTTFTSVVDEIDAMVADITVEVANNV